MSYNPNAAGMEHTRIHVHTHKNGYTLSTFNIILKFFLSVSHLKSSSVTNNKDINNTRYL